MQTSFNPKSRSPAKLLIILGVITGILSISPLLKFHLQGLFFSVDPDVMYVSNAISYIKTAQIHYIDHPGTPAIWLMSKSLIPLRFFAKFIDHTNFIHWFVNHSEYVYAYLRIIQTLLLILATIFFLNSIYKLTRSRLSVLIGWLLFLAFRHFLNFGIVISAEVLTTLSIAIWLYIFSHFVNQRHPLLIIFLSVITGFAVANKLTNIFLIPSTILMPLVFPGLTNKQKVYNIALNSVIVIVSGILFTWPIRNSYQDLFNWILQLFTKSGVHGGGATTLLDWQAYSASAQTLFGNEKILSGLIIVILAIGLYKSLQTRIKIISIELPIYLLTFFTLLGVTIFAKYPLSHYQQTHFLILGYIFLFLTARWHYLIKVTILAALLYFSFGQIYHYLQSIQTQINIAWKVEASSNKHKVSIRVWEWAPTKEFALLWGNFWSGGSYDEELKSSQPNYYAINETMTGYYLDYSHQKEFKDLCFDLYIQSESLPKFQMNNPNMKLIITPIKGTYMTRVESIGCQFINQTSR